MDVLTGYPGRGGHPHHIRCLYLTSDQPHMTPLSVRPSQASAGVWCGATWAKPNPTIRALALVRANLSYVELGQYTQVHGSDAACPCPFLSEIYSVLSRQYQKMTFNILYRKLRLIYISLEADYRKLGGGSERLYRG